MKINEKIFREYDIRGVFGKDFDAEFAYQLGKAYASLVCESSGNGCCGGSAPKVAIGHDCRLSANEVTSSLVKGLIESGVDVLSCGMGPTPQLYFSVVSKNLSGGIQVTASHNPGEYNGFKLMVGLKTLSGSDIQDLKHRVQEGVSPIAKKHGTTYEFDARSVYISELVTRSEPFMGKGRKLKVVVDGGNGVGGLVGPEVLRRLGCEVIELFTDPDGTFPNHHPDPTEVENIEELRKRVVAEKADVGIAWDGDADRIGVVDENGTPIFGDMLVLIYSKQLVKEVSAPIVIGDVKCSDVMFSELKKIGAQPVMAKTGHSLIKAKLKELNAHLAGEMSGHVFFKHRYYGFDDAMHASARLVEILSNFDRPFSALLAGLPETVSTPEIRVECPDEIKFKIADAALKYLNSYKVDTTDGVRVSFERGWGLVRASNTQPALVMRFEADSIPHLNEYRGIVEDAVRRVQMELAK